MRFGLSLIFFSLQVWHAVWSLQAWQVAALFGSDVLWCVSVLLPP